MRIHGWFGVLAGSLLLTLPAFAQSAETLAGMEAYNHGDFATAFRRLSDAATSGDAEAMVNLGYLYTRGQGVARDSDAALRLYRQSAEQGNSEGMNALGYRYAFYPPPFRDLGQAVDWFCRAIALGNARAMNNLALLLDRGQDMSRDVAEARSLWRQAIDLGHTNAMYNLAVSLMNGPDRDPAEATRLVWQAARGGNPLAQAWLRRSGYTGPLPPVRDETAVMIPTTPAQPATAGSAAPPSHEARCWPLCRSASQSWRSTDREGLT